MVKLNFSQPQNRKKTLYHSHPGESGEVRAHFRLLHMLLVKSQLEARGERRQLLAVHAELGLRQRAHLLPVPLLFWCLAAHTQSAQRLAKCMAKTSPNLLAASVALVQLLS